MARCYPAYLIGVIRFSLGDAVAFAQTSLPAETGASKALARSSFASCVQELAAQAQAKGIESEVIQQHLGGLTPDFDTLAGASSQPEFIKPIWDYLDATVSQTRINTGRSKLAEWAHVLDAIERSYGVDRHIVLAIWASSRPTEPFWMIRGS